MHHIDARALQRNSANADYRALVDNGYSEELAIAILCTPPLRDRFAKTRMLLTEAGRALYGKQQAQERRKDRADPSRIETRRREKQRRLMRPGSPFRRGLA